MLSEFQYQKLLRSLISVARPIRNLLTLRVCGGKFRPWGAPHANEANLCAERCLSHGTPLPPHGACKCQTPFAVFLDRSLRTRWAVDLFKSVMC